MSISLVAPPSQAQTKLPRNTVKGVVVDGESDQSKPQYVSKAVAVALTSKNEEINHSKETSKDGHFTLIVPERYREFKLMVYNVEHRYWVYRRQEPYDNNAHPHDLGSIQLDRLSTQLSNSGAWDFQFESAEILNSIDPESSNFILGKVASEHPMVVGHCPAGPAPESITISGLTPSPAAYAQSDPFETVPREVKLPSAVPHDLRSQVIANERAVIKAMEHLNQLQRQYHDREQSYAEFDNLQSARAEDYIISGYCIDLILGTLSHGRFEAWKREGNSSNYYLLFGNPLLWNITGDTYFYSDPSGIVRYSKSRQKLKSLDEAQPVGESFPTR